MISDLKEFEKFLKICRRQGVLDVSCGGISVKMGELPTHVNGSSTEDSEEPETPDAMTPDQLMYYHITNAAGDQQ